MKLKILLITFFCVFYTAAAAANVQLMPVKDLRPGMRGIGKTVISGDTIEDFGVEILGVTGSEATEYNIFVRLYGDLIEKTGGVAQGMSGSPVYVDGRLVGAVAFGKAFNDPHYCFLTPIGSMLRLLDAPVARSSVFLPQGTALLAGGFSARGLEYLQDKLRPLGFAAVGAGGSGAAGDKPLEPGSSVAATIMQGDLSLGALGTVTWVDDGGNVLAFGHPFMQRGECGFFMNRAWVLGCIPNMQGNYKVANIGAGVGTFSQDRANGVAGRIGPEPPSIPLYISVSDTGRGLNGSARVRVVDDEQLVPAILDAAVFNTISKIVDRNGGGTARVAFTITGRNAKKENVRIDRENMYYAADNLLKTVDQELIDAANVLMQNKFEKVDIYGISVNAEVTEDVQVAEITRVTPRERMVRAGDQAALDVALKPYRGAEFTKTVLFKIPADHPAGKITLNVRGGSSLLWLQNLLRKQQEEGMPAAKSEIRHSLDEFINTINKADKNNELIIDLAAAQPRGSAQQAPEPVPGEGSFAGLLLGSPYKQKTAFDFIIDGESDIVLNVVK